jgi:hypothetical protein
MSSYYNGTYEYNKNIPNYQSCYYQNLNGYTNNNFGQVRFNPPLSNAIVYKDVFYSSPNYQSLVKKPLSQNLHDNYPSVVNAYESCKDCDYSVLKKCPNYSNSCMNN